MTFTESDKRNVFDLLSARFEDVARHFKTPDDMFDISSAAWESPNEFIYQFPAVDRVFQFKREGAAWKVREVWLADSAEMRVIAEANGGRYIFDFEDTDVDDGTIRVYVAP
ncbi:MULTISPECIES: hypothetical protein [unclassified Paraburkholderia]|uniref:hypothetical protein n=1 Tax=unclassified Paraburkholderia TaxID=2615204 RepID=UPI00161354F7|nr:MULTISPECIES: hypothetical protein [unclassified Paraburkholderia]MBB5444669.1 hypothetical protein [Paraburkholderia sp. WSM4177]MBB5485494.1 hypothetical protein [Paraburkholderia sp. WSM4180]